MVDRADFTWINVAGIVLTIVGAAIVAFLAQGEAAAVKQPAPP